MIGSTETSPSNGPPRADRPWWQAGLTLLCRYVLAVVFLMAGLTKITDPGAFKERVRHDAHLPAAVASAVALVLPWLELTCGVCLALGHAVREAALLVCLLLVLFLGHALVNHAEPDCGCFLTPLPAVATAAWWPPLRNVLLLACGMCVLRKRSPTAKHRDRGG